MQVRKRKGAALIETAAAAIFLIPIVLGLLDAVSMVICSITNDEIAKNAARAAANQPDESSAFTAAQNAINSVKHSPIIANVTLKDFSYSSSDQSSVMVQSQIECNLPVKIAGMQNVNFVAQSVQPIVALKKQ